MKLGLEFLSKYGFTRFSCNSKDQDTQEIARSIGSVLTFPGIPPIQKLVPCKKESKEESSYSGNYGMSAFPLHTDMAHWYIPPRYVLLRCIHPAPDVSTSVVSVDELINSEDPLTFKRALFRPRRRLDGRLSLLRLYHNHVFRWDTLFIRPMNIQASALQERIEKRIQNVAIQSIIFTCPIDCLLIDNWKALHGRSSVPASGSNRIVERVYLSALKEFSHAENGSRVV